MSVGDITFEKVHNFKYLGVDVHEKANSHEKINRRIIVGNKCYFSLVPLFKSKLTLQSFGQASSIVRLQGINEGI